MKKGESSMKEWCMIFIEIIFWFLAVTGLIELVKRITK